MFCHNCKYEYTTSIKFCPKCGEKISDKSELVAHEAKKQDDTKVQIVSSASPTNSIQLELNQFTLGLVAGLVGTGILMWLILK